MRVLSATPYADPEGGGLERYAHAINSRLAGRGHDVEAVAFTRLAPGLDVRDGVTLQRLRPRLVAGNTPIDPGLTRRLRRHLRATRPDVVAVHTPVPVPAQAAAEAARREGIPYVVTYHAGRLRGSSLLLEAVAALDRWTLERRMLHGARRLIAVGPYVRDNALRRHRERTDVIPPGVDDSIFHPAPRPVREPSVLFVGPLSASYRWKGVDVLWDAFALVRQQRPDAVLRLVGAGDRLPEFRGRSAGDPGIEVLGRLETPELAALYRASAVTVLPSLTDAESFGMVLAEANASGRPVVASRVGGIPDFVRDGDNGLLANPGDPADLARCILEVLEDPRAADAMGERGRRRVRAEHGWDTLARRTEAVLQDAVGG